MQLINLIEYGNPTREEFDILVKEPQLKNVEGEFLLYPPAKNDSEYTALEIDSIIEEMDKVFPEMEEMQKYALYDSQLEEYLHRKVLVDSGLSVHQRKQLFGLINKVRQKTDAILLRLKFKFQRPRPYQLARVLKKKLFPYTSNTAHTPSYPSGHAFQATIWSSVISYHYPELKDKLDEWAKDVSHSRIALGLHYPSDIDGAIYLSELFMNDADFKKMFLGDLNAKVEEEKAKVSPSQQ